MKTTLESILLRDAEARLWSTPAGGPEPQIQEVFKEKLAALIEQPAGPSAGDPETAGPGWTPFERQSFVTDRAESQQADAPVAPSQEPVGGPAKARSDADDPVAILAEALRQAGIDPDNLRLSTSKETYHFLDRTFEFHHITARIGDTERRYDVDLMLRNPDVTVIEIQAAMGRPRPSALTAA